MRFDTCVDTSTLNLQVLGVKARVSGPGDLLDGLRRVAPITPPWLCAALPPSDIEFNVKIDEDTGLPSIVSTGGELTWTPRQKRAIVPYLEWAINSAAVEHLTDHYLVHAGVVACGEAGVIMPAGSGSGKSTLVAALVAAGCRYLSDEVAVIDPAPGALLPFAKSLYIRPASRAVLASTYPELKAETEYREENGQPLWYLPPRAGWLPDGPVPLRATVIPRYLPGASTTLEPAARSTVLGCLLEQSFNLQGHGRAGIAGLTRLLQSTACYTLAYGDLSDAVETLLAVIGV